VYSIFEDRGGSIWIGTESSLNRFEAVTETFTRFGRGNLRQVVDAHVDEQGIFWLLWRHDFSRFDPLTGIIKNYPDHATDGQGFARSSGVQLTICESANGYLWTGGWRADVNIFDPRTERFTQVRPNPNDPHSLPENIIRKIYRDRSGNMWFGTASSGVAKLTAQDNPFKEYDLGGKYQVRAVAEDDSETLLIGTWGDYIMAKDRGATGFKRLPSPVKSSDG